jgi:polyisoprenyl-teichoic acid--peptidoglycan teichoic acid transferase
MKLIKINFLSGNRQPRFGERTGASPAKPWLSLLSIVGVFLFSFGFGRLSLSESATAALANLPLIKQMHLIGSPDRQLAGEDSDRINVLLLGMGGEGHDGPLLTDTIMVASIRPSDSQVALLSIPRDLLVPLPKAGWRRINTANAFGELEMPGRGGEATRVALEGLLGIDIPYYVRADFSGFKSLIDDIDGVDVYVERNFTDNSYPTDDYLIQTVSFEKGYQHMDSETALRFARSRHGNNGEGSDFARAKRQQKILAAVKEKVLDFRTFKNPALISNLLAELQSNIATNMQVGDILRLARIGRNIDPTAIVHKVIDDGPNSPLQATVVNGAFVLVPRKDDWSDLRRIAAEIFIAGQSDVIMAAAPKELPPTEKPRVEIQNGSGRTGLARQISGLLSDAGFMVTKIGNADSFGFQKTTVYDLTGGKNEVAISGLKRALGTDIEIIVSPLAPHGASASGIDFLVILGKNMPDQI